MSWRNHRTHQEETKAVKEALKSAGYQGAKVSHGSGTAWAWLEIRAEVAKPADCSCSRLVVPGMKCNRCQEVWEENYRGIHRIAREVTGRQGDHNGDTLVMVELI